MLTPSWVSTPTQPIALNDAARYLAGVCGNGSAQGYDTGGPEVMTYRQMIERIAALLGRKPRIHPGPRGDPVLLLALAQPRHAGQCLAVAWLLIEGLRNPTIAREERIRQARRRRVYSFDEAARQALA